MIVPFFVLVRHVDADEVGVLVGSALYDSMTFDDSP